MEFICKRCKKKVTYLDENKHKELIDSCLCGYCKFCEDYPEPKKRK